MFHKLGRRRLGGDSRGAVRRCARGLRSATPHRRVDCPEVEDGVTTGTCGGLVKVVMVVRGIVVVV